MISVVINCDNRSGYLTSSAGSDYGKYSLQGVRSVDFLTHGVRQKINYFRGHDIQCILYIDKHDNLDSHLFYGIEEMVLLCGNNSKVIFKEHERTSYKWNDKIYIEALKLAEGDYVVHFDQDCNAYRTDESNVINQYFEWLETYKYVCQPWDGIGDEMFHASTRFFICKKETLEQAFREDLLTNPLRGSHNPCLEFSLGLVAGKGSVLYPPRDDNNYLVFSWATYKSGTLKKLNNLPYGKVKEYILSCGLHGPMDCIDNPINNE
jgi:hypothetical protein